MIWYLSSIRKQKMSDGSDYNLYPSILQVVSSTSDCEFKANLAYKLNSQTITDDTQKNLSKPKSKNPRTQKANEPRKECKKEKKEKI